MAGKVFRERDVAKLECSDLAAADLVFEWKGYRYRTTGERIGGGGGALVWGAQRFPLGKQAAAPEDVVVRIPTRVAQARNNSDSVARRVHEQSWQVAQVLESLHHPHVMHNYLTARISDTWITVRPRFTMDLRHYVFGGACGDLRDCMRLFVQALEGLAFLHKHQIVHGDFTPQNVALAPDADGAQRAVVFDFDLSLCLDLVPAGTRTYLDYLAGTQIGTPGFSMLPEIVRKDLRSHPISPRGDVYAAGAHLYCLLTGESVLGPLDDCDQIEVLARIGRNAPPRLLDQVPRGLRPIIARCLCPDPRDRYAGAGELLGEIAGAARSQWQGKPLTSRSIAIADHPRVVFASRPDASLTQEAFDLASHGIVKQGYRIERCLHRLKGHGAFIVCPDPKLVADGLFPERNPFKKVATALDLRGMSESEREDFLRDWNEHIEPAIGCVRQRYLTPLFMASYDAETRHLLLFTEYLSNPRFGGDLLAHELYLSQVLALAMELAMPLRELHGRGLAHNNVSLATVMFKADPQTETARPLLAGLVEPSLDSAHCQEDVRQYARVVTTMLGRATCVAPSSQVEHMAQALTDELLTIAEEDSIAPAMDWVAEPVARVLAELDPDFARLSADHAKLEDYFATVLHPLFYSLLFRAEA
jgi:serine/threonine protein kinase